MIGRAPIYRKRIGGGGADCEINKKAVEICRFYIVIQHIFCKYRLSFSYFFISLQSGAIVPQVTVINKKYGRLKRKIRST